MTDQQQRYLVRLGTKGWMVWDRLKKGPATVLKREFVNFETEEQALFALRTLALAPDAKTE